MLLSRYTSQIRLLIGLLFLTSTFFAQLSDECKLNIGTNLAEISDYGTEIPFVDLMKHSRMWYTKSVGDPTEPFDSEFASELVYRADGYPTHIPQSISGSIYPQRTATIWANTEAWPEGEYVVLYDGTGELDFWGSLESFEQTASGRIIVNFPDTSEGTLEMTIISSDISNPIRNIRVLMPGKETTYETEPFYDVWLEKLEPFNTVRFMDWGHTNGWGQIDDWTIADETLVDWEERSQPDFFTYTHSKGVPYKSMLRLMNDYDKDGWVCVPHNASENYIRNMASYFRDNLEPERHLYVEYSNEVWNWMFGQAQWTFEYGCEATGTDWPEGIVPYFQNTMDYWTDEFSGQLNRITRVVAIQTGWLDVSQRIASNMNPDSYDVISPTYYFGISEEGDSALDILGTSATVTDIAFYARENMPQEMGYVSNIKNLANELDKEIVFYEGGQHLTPIPFGEPSTYDQALLDIQRDPEMYNMYNEWYDIIRSFQEGDTPLLLMNYAFVAPLSAQYGSWGILETMNQDFSEIPAPKYTATLENIGCDLSYSEEISKTATILFPNPTDGNIHVITAEFDTYSINIIDLNGRVLKSHNFLGNIFEIDISMFETGLYTLVISSNINSESYKLIKK